MYFRFICVGFGGSFLIHLMLAHKPVQAKKDLSAVGQWFSTGGLWNCFSWVITHRLIFIYISYKNYSLDLCTMTTVELFYLILVLFKAYLAKNIALHGVSAG